MTSKNLYFNLLKEDMKRRIWTLALAMLVFVIGLPIYAMLRLDRIKELIENGGIVNAQAYFAGIARSDNKLLIMITFVGALICAINGFTYLFSKSKVDLYHSIPVRREKLFIVTYINGVLIYVIPYLVNLVLYFIVGAANGLLTKGIWNQSMQAFGINLLGYVFLYSVIIIAVVMTGNIIVCFLGTATFMLYGPVLLIIQTAICETFLETYYQPFDEQEKLKYVSPIFAYNYLTTLTSKNGFAMYFIGFVAATIIALVIGIYLYKIRPSEAAGKSMAFEKTQIPIKFLIVLPTTIVGGLLFMSMTETNSFAWMIFGIIFVGFLSHGMIEIIYHNDFKYMIAHKIQLVIGIAFALAIALVVKMDLFQYDSYIPNTDKVKSISISFENSELSEDYFDLENEYSDSMQYSYYQYVPATTYQLDHMNITNFENVYRLVQYAKDNNISETETQTMNSDNLISFTVKYTFENKEEKYRYYTVKLKDITDYIKDIYTDENFKEGVYQILTMDKSLIDSISYYNSVDDTHDMLKLIKQQKQEFIDIYTNELRTLSGTQLLESTPVTELIFSLSKKYNYISKSYYVYPEFTKTIEYMKSLGANLDSDWNLDNIESITISDYSYDNEGLFEITTEDEMTNDELKEYTKNNYLKEYKFTDKEQIEAILNAAIPNRLTDGNVIGIIAMQNLEASIEYKDKNVGSASVIVDKLPDDIRQQIGY